ncbi:MAG: hypothetical protein ACJAT2_000314 [Bacteriovoracaceae bacterium]|jgi:hypothetical protein
MGNQALRSCHDWNEILNVLEEIRTDGSLISIWAKGQASKARQSSGWEIDQANGQLKLNESSLGFHFLKNKEATIYIKGKEKSVLFRQKKILSLGDTVVLDIPEKVNMYDRRGVERTSFGWHSKHFTQLSFTKNSKDYDLLFSIFDISPSGLALNISPHEESIFEPGDIIHIHKLGQTNLMIPLRAQVKHLGTLDFIDKGIHFKRIKLGLEFTKNLNLLCFTELFEG